MITAVGTPLRALAITLSFLSMVVLVVSPTTPSARAAEITVAAIGDSYLAGIGAGAYTTTDGCRRSANSPAAHLARRIDARLVDLTCPGDTITSASRRASSLPPSLDLVVVQVGGNDLGFTRLAAACLIGSASLCDQVVSNAHRRLPGIRSGLLSLVRQIRLLTPTSDIMVLGYPRLLGSPERCDHLLDSTVVRSLERLQRILDGVIRSASGTAGADFTDWPRTVDRASLCSADPWYALPGDRIDDLLHPDSRATIAMGRQLTRQWSR